MLERDQHLVVDLGEDLEASPLARAQLDGRCPVGLVQLGEPRQLDLDAAELLRVDVVRDDPDRNPGRRGAGGTGPPVSPSSERSAAPLTESVVV